MFYIGFFYAHNGNSITIKKIVVTQKRVTHCNFVV